MSDVLGDFAQRANEIELTLKEGSSERALYRKVIGRIDPQKVAAMQDKHRSRLAHFVSGAPSVDRAGPEKYFDIPFYVAARVRSVLDLGLADSSPKTILDIGVGPGHFAAICNSLNHQTLGIDIEAEFYADLCEALAVDRQVCPVFRLEKLPCFSRRFDLVTAIWICFDQIGEDARGHRIYWSLNDWRFLLNDLFVNQINDTGEIYFVLNMQVRRNGTTEFDTDVFDWLESIGAKVDRQWGSVRLSKETYKAAEQAPKAGGDSAAAGSTATEPKEHHTETPGIIIEHSSMRDKLTVKPLIFETSIVPLAFFESLGTKSTYFASVEPFETGPYTVLGNFPIPGHLTNETCSRPQFLNGSVQFNELGEYYFYSQVGAFKVLVIDPNSTQRERILKIFSFVARNSVHSLADQWKYQINGINRFFDFSPLIQKLFFSDQPLMLHCSGISEILIAILHYFGVSARLAHMLRAEDLDGHMVVEAFDSEAESWIFLDADYGVTLLGSDRPLSVADVARSVQKDDLSFTIVDCGRKFWLRPDRNFPLKFVGDATWSPEQNSGAHCADEAIYKNILIKYAKVINRYKYSFESPWRGKRNSIANEDAQAVISTSS